MEKDDVLFHDRVTHRDAIAIRGADPSSGSRREKKHFFKGGPDRPIQLAARPPAQESVQKARKQAVEIARTNLDAATKAALEVTEAADQAVENATKSKG